MATVAISKRTREFWATVGAATLLQFTAVEIDPASANTPAHGPSCDRHRATLNSAIALRDQRQFEKAKTIVNFILEKDPKDFRSNFILATILLHLTNNRTEDDPGIKTLKFAESLLPAQPVGCNERYGWYSLYNTLGAEYFKRGNIVKTEHYLGLAYQHIDYLYAETTNNLLFNLGTLRYTQGKTEEALDFYDRAAKLGSKSAAKRALTIRKIKAPTL